MGYIESVPKTVFNLHCTHPKVNKIWEYGKFSELPPNSEAIRVICITLIQNPSEIHQFEDKGDGEAVKNAEKFLEGLGE